MKQSQVRGQLCCPLLLLVLLSGASVAAAEPEIEALSPLDLGTVAIPTNDTESSLFLPRSGSPIAGDGAFVLIEPGEPGRYQLMDFPPNTTIEVEVESVRLSLDGMGALVDDTFRVGDFDHGDVQTGPTGEADLQLGGELLSSGAGVDYDDGPYSGTTTLRLRYWDPDLGDYVTESTAIEPLVETRTSIEIEEAESLHFGTLSARAGSGGKASMQLDPDGGVELSNEGEARLVVVAPPQPALLQVTGAAPDQVLSIEPQDSEVVLRHQSDAGTEPVFILSDLVSDPDGTGETDEDGMLEVRVGGTLSTEEVDVARPYPEGVYKGTYELMINY